MSVMLTAVTKQFITRLSKVQLYLRLDLANSSNLITIAIKIENTCVVLTANISISNTTVISRTDCSKMCMIYNVLHWRHVHN